MTGASDGPGPDGPVLAVDIGGTKIAAAMVRGGRCLDRRQVETPRTGRGDDLVAAMLAAVAMLAALPAQAPRRLAVATTGLVRDGRLTALNPATLPVEDGYPLADAVERATGIRPLLVNDAQAAAWGEYRFGAGRGSRGFAFVTVSTGIGAGLVLQGRLLTGGGLAGHLGHTMSEPEGPVCGCGRRGCLEVMASGTAIAQHAGGAPNRGTGAGGGTQGVFAAARAGDAACGRAIADAAARIAVALGSLVALCDVDVIAMGGGVGLAAGFLDQVRDGMRVLPPAFRREIVQAAAGPDAGLLGAADLVRQARRRGPVADPAPMARGFDGEGGGNA